MQLHYNILIHGTQNIFICSDTATCYERLQLFFCVQISSQHCLWWRARVKSKGEEQGCPITHPTLCFDTTSLAIAVSWKIACKTAGPHGKAEEQLQYDVNIWMIFCSWIEVCQSGRYTWHVPSHVLCFIKLFANQSSHVRATILQKGNSCSCYHFGIGRRDCRIRETLHASNSLFLKCM